ncbi:tail length tape measure protein [Lactococcus phage 16802]|uniref:Putative tape measure protein n=1 Tax=Lactococcus phage 16802 TaxID=2029659 RepID=A0A343JNP3_9CAUD|nr:tail length tape measure protein [Lactococcus phage 16802]ASZ71116.1 putative tape measure protein [Lactococcus phage 16802]
MASNAQFEVEIYGNTTKFENSLKGVNTAMSGLRGEAKNLREALKLDPTNTSKMSQLQKNLQTQLGLSRDKATKLKEELATVDKSSPAGQKKWLQLTRDLGTAETQANRLEGEIRQVESAISSGSWNIEAKMDTKGVNSGIDGMKSRFSSLREIAVGAFRQIGASAVSAVGNGLKGWVSDAMDTQKAMISLQNTMKFKGNGQDFDYVSKSMQNLAKATNANTEDTIKLSTTFIGLGDTAKKAVDKTEALVKANQAFGGTGEQLKGVVQAYGQMSASGKVTAENINQLTDNNTALGSALKSTVMEMNPALKQYSSFAEASEEGAISVEMLDKAMQKLGKAGGGGVTTISDAWDSFNETLSLALLPTLDALTPIISDLIDKMSDWGESAGKAVSNVVKYFQDLFQKLQENAATLAFLEAWDNIKSAFDSIVSIIGNVINSFLGINTETTKNATSIDNVAKSIAVFAGKLSEITKKIADFLKKISESKTAMSVLKGTLVVLASAFAAFKVATGILGVIDAFKTIGRVAKSAMVPVKALFGLIIANPFVAIAVAIAAVVAGLIYFFTQTETGKKAWQSFVDFLSQSIEAIKQFFTGLGTWFSELWTSTVEGTKTIWNGITDFFSGLWNGIVTIITNVFATIASAVTGAYNWFVTTFQPLISFYQSIFNLIGSIINAAFQLILAIIRGAYQLVIGAWKGLSGFFGGIFNAVSSVASSVFSAIGSFASSAWGVVRSIWSAAAGFFSGIFNAVRGVVSGVFSSLGGFASNAWSRISGVFSGVASFFSGVFNGARNAVSGAFSAFAGFASNAYNAIIGVFSGLGSFFSGLFGGISSMINSVLGGVTNTINNISGAINGIAGKLGGLFKGSMVVGLTDVNLSSSGYGLSTNSVSSDNRTYNTFNVQGGAGQDVSNLARAIRREFELGRA